VDFEDRAELEELLSEKHGSKRLLQHFGSVRAVQKPMPPPWARS